MKLILCTVLAVLATSVSGEKNEISFVSPTISRLIQNAAENRILETEVLAIIECFQKVLSAGLPEHGIPSFNPLQIPELKIDLDSLGIPEATGFLNFETLVLGGIMGFKVDHLKIDVINIISDPGLSVEITLSFDAINLNSDYEADLQVAGIPVDGKGDVKLDVTNLQLEMALIVRLNDPKPTERIFVESMKFLPSVENVHIEFTGLFNDEQQTQLVNDLLNSVLTNWVNEKAQDISDLIESIIKNIINNLTPTEPGEPGEDLSLIEIILNECRDDPITTPQPSIDCNDPEISSAEKLVCFVESAIGLLQGLLELVDPLPLTDIAIDLGTIGGKGIWTFDKLGLSGHSNFVLGEVTAKVGVIIGVGLGGMVTIPLHWDLMDLDITEHGDVEILGMKITAEDSKVMGFLRNFDLELTIAIGGLVPSGSIKKVDIRIKPTIAENDIKGIISGVSLNGEDISGSLTSFINNDLGKFLVKHGEDMGDLVAAFLIPIIEDLLNNPETPNPENPVLAHVAEMIKQLVTKMQQNL